MFLLLSSLLLPSPSYATEAVIEPGGEVRTHLAFTRLDDLYAETPDAEAESEFGISRARLWVDATLHERLTGKFAVDFGQDLGVTTYETASGDSVDVSDESTGWRTRVVNGFLRWSAGESTVTFGAQMQCFGLRCTYMRDKFYYAGVKQFLPLAQRSGAVKSHTMGVAWKRPLGERAELYGLVSNGVGITGDETGLGKDATATLHVWPMEALRLTGSAIVGPRGPAEAEFGEMRFAWSGAAVLGLDAIRLYADTVGISQEDDRGFGWELGAGHDVALGGDLDRLEMLVRGGMWDPSLESSADSTLATAGALNLYWATYEKVSAMSGLVYEVKVPEDLNSAIGHEAVVQVRLVF